MAEQNLIWIYGESLRPEMLSAGDDALAALLRPGTLFSEVRSAAPFTRGALHAALTGHYPSVNGISAERTPNSARSERCPTLTQALAARGYHTIGYSPGVAGHTVPQAGFHLLTSNLERFWSVFERRREPYFAFFHVAGLWSYLQGVAQERGRFANADESAALFLGWGLDELDEVCGRLWVDDEEQLRVLSSDNCFPYPDESAPATFLSEGSLRTVCHISGAGVPEGEHVASAVRSIDIASSLVELLVLPPMGRGISLFPLVPERGDLPSCAELGRASGDSPSPLASNVWVARQGPWKYGYHSRYGEALVHLGKAPLERRNFLDAAGEFRDSAVRDVADVLKGYLEEQLFGGIPLEVRAQQVEALHRTSLAGKLRLQEAES